MLAVVSQLLQLQERDQRIRALTKDLKDNPKLQEHAKSRLADDEAAVAGALARVREVEIKIKNVELDVQTRRNTIARLKDQQFATRKNEEFQAMGHEIQRYEKEVVTLEDQELELMEALESVKPALATAQQQLASTKKHVDEELKELAERAKAIEARITELKTERAGLAEPIEPSALSLYDRLMKNKGDAVALMEAGICKGCHVKVVSGTLQSLKADENITQCEQCGRILYKEG
jgi:predicted  nucleic acid-binding Zn-ribbon protein